jgi:tryptophan synthase alpha chain
MSPNKREKETAMNRIITAMENLKAKKEKAFITYMTAGLPDKEGCKALIKAQETAGVDVIELGIPFSDPSADGPVIQETSKEAIEKGVNLRNTFTLVQELRTEGIEIPIIFMMYYNTAFHYGLEAFVAKCKEAGVDGIIIPDLPLEEQGELSEILKGEESPLLIQLVSPTSKTRIADIVKGAKGFLYCVSSLGVTGRGGAFYREIEDYFKRVKSDTDMPLMMGFGIRTPDDVLPMKDLIDGAIVGSHFITLMKQCDYDPEKAAEYCRDFREKWNETKS